MHTPFKPKGVYLSTSPEITSRVQMHCGRAQPRPHRMNVPRHNINNYAVATAPSPVERISTAKEPATGKGSPKAKVLALGTCALVNHACMYIYMYMVYHEAFVMS